MLNRLGAPPIREYLGDARAPYCGTAHITTSQMRRELLGVDPSELRARLEDAAGTGSRLRQAMLVDQRLRLPSDLLMRTDRATMAWSIEARVPLLANEVLETSWRVADRDLSTILPPVNKPLLKGIASGLVPRSAVYRRKGGFRPATRKMARRRFWRPHSGPAQRATPAGSGLRNRLTVVRRAMRWRRPPRRRAVGVVRARDVVPALDRRPAISAGCGRGAARGLMDCRLQSGLAVGVADRDSVGKS